MASLEILSLIYSELSHLSYLVPVLFLCEAAAVEAEDKKVAAGKKKVHF